MQQREMRLREKRIKMRHKIYQYVNTSCRYYANVREIANVDFPQYIGIFL